MQKLKPTKNKARCDVDKCRRRAKVKYECRTCEALVAAGKAEAVFIVNVCRPHSARGKLKIRRHALIAHPVNILRAGIAALKGEDLS
jgi:hypothetical protein